MKVARERIVDSSDLELVERHRRGDREAFTEIYLRFEEMVYNLAQKLVGEDDADDLTQEIFLRVFRHVAGFRGGSSLKTWIYRVALNCCRSRRRLRSVQVFGRETAALEAVPDERRGPEQRAAAAEAGRRLERALHRVSGTYREAVVLRDIEGLTYQEIADVLGVRIGTVRSRIARGRESLRRRLEDER